MTKRYEIEVHELDDGWGVDVLLADSTSVVAKAAHTDMKHAVTTALSRLSAPTEIEPSIRLDLAAVELVGEMRAKLDRLERPSEMPDMQSYDRIKTEYADAALELLEGFVG